MPKKPSMKDLAEQLGTDQKGQEQPQGGATAYPQKKAPQERENRSDYLKATVTLPPRLYEKLMLDVAQRKIRGEKNAHMSTIIRELVAAHYGEE